MYVESEKGGVEYSGTGRQYRGPGGLNSTTVGPTHRTLSFSGFSFNSLKFLMKDHDDTSKQVARRYLVGDT